MARTAADVALVWNVLSPGQEPVTRRLRLGYVGPEVLGDLPAEIRDAVRSAVMRLAAAGQAVPVEVHPPPFANWHPHRRVPLLIDALAVHRRAGWYPDSRAQYGTRMRAFLDHSTQLTVADVADALRHITTLSERLMDCFLRCDVLVLPATPMTAPRFDDLTDRGESSQPPIDQVLTRLCAPINFCPLAAVAMPCGTSMEGLPIGLQFIARDEATALNCARRLEM
jgi:aspartyl-tRNA(Asn)/glutamyl-tRNA(Gln) amidotransferase subunit A